VRRHIQVEQIAERLIDHQDLALGIFQQHATREVTNNLYEPDPGSRKRHLHLSALGNVDEGPDDVSIRALSIEQSAMDTEPARGAIGIEKGLLSLHRAATLTQQLHLLKESVCIIRTAPQLAEGNILERTTVGKQFPGSPISQPHMLVGPHQQNGRRIVVQQRIAQLGLGHPLADIALRPQYPLALFILYRLAPYLGP